MILLRNSKERSRFFRFAFVGAVGAVVDFGIFNILTQLTSISAVVASIISFSCAVMSNFIWNRFWTYPESRSKPVSQQLVQFGIISVIGLIIRTPLFAGMEYILIKALDGITPDGFLSPIVIAHNISLATAIVVVMLWNFFANRYWTYGDLGIEE